MDLHPRWEQAFVSASRADQSAARSGPAMSPVPRGPARLREIRERVRDGHYASSASARALAERMVERRVMGGMG